MAAARARFSSVGKISSMRSAHAVGISLLDASRSMLTTGCQHGSGKHHPDIVRWIERADRTGKTDDLRKEMEAAVADYGEVTLPFSPHELAESSRRRELEPAMAKSGSGAAAGRS